jgi:hypothetical protein
MPSINNGLNSGIKWRTRHAQGQNLEPVRLNSNLNVWASDSWERCIHRWEERNNSPLYTQDKILTLHHFRWLPQIRWPGLCAWHEVSWWTFVPQNSIHFIWKFLHAQRRYGIDKFGCTHARTHTQTLNNHYDNYIKLSASGLDKNPLTTKHNISKHKQDTVLITKFWYLFLTFDLLWPWPSYYARQLNSTRRTFVLSCIKNPYM